MENTMTITTESITGLDAQQRKLEEYLDQVCKYHLYSLNDFVDEFFYDPSVLEWIDVREFLKRKKIVRKLFEMYVKEFLRDYNYDISLPFYDNGIYWFFLEIRNNAQKSFRIVKSKKENFLRDSLIILTKLAEYYLYLTNRRFRQGITWNKYYDGTDIIKLKIESLPYDKESQAYILKIMSHIRDLGTNVEYDF
jgi:hypothetical protein